MSETIESYLLKSFHAVLLEQSWQRLGTSRSVGERQTQYARRVGEMSAVLWIKTVQMNWPDDQSAVIRFSFGNGSAAHSTVIARWEERTFRKILFFAASVPPAVKDAWPNPPIRPRFRETGEYRCQTVADCDCMVEWLGRIQNGFLLPWANAISTHDLTARYLLEEGERQLAALPGRVYPQNLPEARAATSLSYLSQALAVLVAGGDRGRAVDLAGQLHALTRSLDEASVNRPYYDVLIKMARE